MRSRNHHPYSSSEILDSERNERSVNQTLIQNDLHPLLEEDCSSELSPSSRVVTMIVTDDETSLLGFRVGSEDVGCETLGTRTTREGREKRELGRVESRTSDGGRDRKEATNLRSLNDGEL